MRYSLIGFEEFYRVALKKPFFKNKQLKETTI